MRASIVPVGQARDRGRGEVGARSAGGRKDAHRRRRPGPVQAQSRRSSGSSPASCSRATTSPRRHARGPPMPFNVSLGKPLVVVSAGSLRLGPARARIPKRGIQPREPPHPLALPRPRRHRARAPRRARRAAAQGRGQRTITLAKAHRGSRTLRRSCARRSRRCSRSPAPGPSRPPNGRATSRRCSTPPASPASARSTPTSSRRAPSGTKRSASFLAWSESRAIFRSPRRCRFLKRHCADTLFQPESPDAPIQILGVLESAGLRFDCLWVSGLTDEAWPLDAQAQPLHPDRGAEEGRHPAGERGSLGGARPAHHGRMEALRRRSGVLLSAEGRGPRLRPFAPHRRHRRKARRDSRFPALPRSDFRISEN